MQAEELVKAGRTEGRKDSITTSPAHDMTTSDLTAIPHARPMHHSAGHYHAETETPMDPYYTS